MAETARRRDKQTAHNKAHGITPKGVEKSVQDIMEGARRMPTRAKGKGRKVAEPRPAFTAELEKLTPAALSRKLKQLENQMYEHARNLEFEEAAALRDQLTEIKTICHSGRKANMVVRVDDEGYALKEGAQVEIGGNERYVSVSRAEFKKVFIGGQRIKFIEPVVAEADDENISDDEKESGSLL